MSFKTSKEATTHAKKVLAILGSGWKDRVWENLGWNCAWQRGSINLYYSTYNKFYSVLIGEPRGWSGHADLSHDDVPSSKDPKEAVRLACDYAINVFETEWRPIEMSVNQVRRSLEI